MLLCSTTCSHGTNRHHLAYSASWYKEGIAKRYRNLPCNIVRMCVEVHKLIHATVPPPPRPSAEFMRMKVKEHKRGACRCSRR